jgi:hypothetical protein
MASKRATTAGSPQKALGSRRIRRPGRQRSGPAPAPPCAPSQLAIVTIGVVMKLCFLGFMKESEEAKPVTKGPESRRPTRSAARDANVKSVLVGGVMVAPEDLAAAVAILTASNGIVVKQPLARAGHPLAEYGYHAVAKAERANEESAQSATKDAFIMALARLIG